MTNKKAQHTPRPWRLEKDRFNNWQIYGKSKNVLDDLPIADNIMSDADAHLLAAAPTMFKTLKTLAAYYRGEIEINGTDRKVMVDEAIAKVEGWE